MANHPAPPLQQAIASSQSDVRQTHVSTLPASEVPQSPESLLEEVVVAAEPEAYPPSKLYIDKKLPDGVSILHVYAHGDEQYMVWGNGPFGRLRSNPKNRPHLALGEMVQSHIHPKLEVPQIIRDLMGLFSRTNQELRRWLRQLKPQQPYLVIADHTDFEIPWEMVELDWGEYLGATFAVARWQHVIDGAENLWLQVLPEECDGHVVAHVNRKELVGIGPEVTLLETLDSSIIEDIGEFGTTLEQPASGVGLVYIATHGIFDKDDIRKSALGSLEEKGSRITLMASYRRPWKLIQKSRSIVFLNLCHSGRLMMEKKYTGGDEGSYRYGFAELFLSKGARGVIAALGGVGDTYAAELARNLIGAILEQPGTPISILLRDIRAQVVKDLPENPDDDQLLPFIYTFMYVYYGNPMTILRLNARD